MRNRGLLHQSQSAPQTERVSLHEFMLESWKVVEPATEFIDNWHIHVICEHLEAVTRGEIRKLIINIPPRCQKSLMVSVFWPMWVWTFNPASRWMFSSYAETLAMRDSLKCRRIIQSNWYQEKYGSVFRLTSDQNVKTRFENDKTGFRLATGVGGVGTGEGGDYICVDDAHKVGEAESDTVRQGVCDWWNETMSTRGNDPKKARWVIVMQRVHDRDLTGDQLTRDTGYEHLCIPMRYEEPPSGTKHFTSLGEYDSRTADGELMWPERFGENEVVRLEREMGSYAAAGQLQQRPSPRRGGMFQREWFKIVASSPIKGVRVRYWDKAATDGAGDYTAGVLINRTADGWYIEDVVRGQWSPMARENIVKSTSDADKSKYGSVTVWLEEEGGSGGKESAHSTITNLAGHVVHSERPTGDKSVRAEPLAVQCEAGNVYLVEGAWNHDFIQELCAFPTGAHDDQVDGAGGAFNKTLVVKWFENEDAMKALVNRGKEIEPYK